MNEHTRILHEREEKWRGGRGGPVNPPIYRASLFTFDTMAEFRAAMADSNVRPVYSRGTNPTVAALEEKIAILEQTECAITFSSGMGGISAVLMTFLKAGDHILVVDCVYGPTRELADHLAGKFGIEVEYFSPEETKDGAAPLADRITPATKLIYLESPGSLAFALQDIRAVTRLAQKHEIVTAIDNSWASPLFQKPHLMGVDVVIHTGSKYLSGHSDLVFGAVACSELHFRAIKEMAVLLGANQSPADAYLGLRGLRTLPLRMERHHHSGLAVAGWLEQQPEVIELLHPGLASNRSYALGRSQMTGYGGLFGFRLQPAPVAAHHAFVEALNLFSIGVSWGGFESLILPLDFVEGGNDPLRRSLGITGDQFRIFVGLEDPADLIQDLEQGLSVWNETRSR